MSQSHRVAVLAVPPVKTFDLSMPAAVFSAASAAGQPLYDVRICTADPGVIAADVGPAPMVPHGLDTLDWADTVIVPSSTARAEPDPRACEALRRAHAAGARIASICSGAFVLGHAGLLDGREATTHWNLADEMARRFPQVQVRPDVLYIDEGDVLTSAGAAAGIDLCLHLVRVDHGAAQANSAARANIVTPLRSGGQAQFVETPLPAEYGGSLATTREWALAHLDQRLGLVELAAHARVSTRTLTRRFRAETGMSVQRWLVQQRLERAKELLEQTGLGIDQIAARSGLGSAESLRQIMARTHGVTPSAYRAAFRVAAS